MSKFPSDPSETPRGSNQVVRPIQDADRVCTGAAVCRAIAATVAHDFRFRDHVRAGTKAEMTVYLRAAHPMIVLFDPMLKLPLMLPDK